MRIAFDLDDTLIPSLCVFPVERSTPWILRGFLREPLRLGTAQLLRDLQGLGHDIWIYTTSWRSPLYLKVWFRILGVRLGGVVNGRDHEVYMRRGGPKCSKYPSAFGIDLLIDDSPGVEQEGQQYGFKVFCVDPANLSWTDAVRSAVAEADDRRRRAQVR